MVQELSFAAQVIEPVVSSTNIVSTSAMSNRAMQVVDMTTSGLPNIFITVIGRVMVATPDT